ISAATSPFAAFTFAKRFPFIINQIKTDNQLTLSQEAELTKLQLEIQDGVVPHHNALFHPDDWVFWEQFLTAYAGKPYVEVPFYAAEAYIYYRIIGVLDYRNSGLDPFGKQKLAGLNDHRHFVEAFADAY